VYKKGHKKEMLFSIEMGRKPTGGKTLDEVITHGTQGKSCLYVKDRRTVFGGRRS